MNVQFNELEKATAVLALRQMATTELKNAIAFYEGEKRVDGEKSQSRAETASALADKIGKAN